MVPLLVILTVIVFIIVNLALRLIMQNLERRKVRKARKEALDIGLKLDYTEEALSLKRVTVDNPKAKILAVDDEEIVLSSFRKILALDGFSIDTVERGKEALGLVQKNDYDFVFVDLKMPELDGVEVTKAVKHFRPDIDVIVITGYASIESAVATMKYGAMDYVQKPFTEDELVGFVNKSLIRRQDRIERLAKPQIHLVTPSIGADKSKHVINVPAGVFISSSHTWMSMELNGMAKVGVDDFAQKILGPFEDVELPKVGQRIEKGDPLFGIGKEDHKVDFPSPISGNVVSINTELLDHLEYLQMKPYELGWMCTIEPTNLPGDLQTLTIGASAISWYQQEIDKFSEKISHISESGRERESAVEEKKRIEDEVWNAFVETYLRS